MKVIVGVWGNPKQWKEVNYIYKENSYLSSTSLTAIENSEIEKDEDYKIIIICADTVADSILDIEDMRNIKNYAELKNKVIHEIRNYYKNQRKTLKIEPSVIVGYGVGKFSNIEFESYDYRGMSDFYYSILYQLAFEFEEVIKNEKIEVIFDATHGLNYMLLQSYKAMKEVLQILSYGYKIGNITFKVLNSEPYVPNQTLNLNIHVVEHVSIFPSIIAYRSEKRPIEPDNSDISEKNDIHLFLSSFMHALPIHTISYVLDQENIKKKIEETIGRYEDNYIRINMDLNKVQVKRNARFTIEFENLVKAYLVSMILSKEKIAKKDWIKLSEIRDLNDKFFKDKRKTEAESINREIQAIRKIRQKIKGESQKYSQIINGSSNLGKRNFFAHAGFEHNCILLKKENKTILIKIDEDSREKQEKLILESLPQDIS